MNSDSSLFRTRATTNNWFKSRWIDENERSLPDHGEFQSPVWLAIGLAIMADRHADIACLVIQRRSDIPGTSHDNRGGQLRELLACVASSIRGAGRSSIPPTLLTLTVVSLTPPPNVEVKASVISRR